MCGHYHDVSKATKGRKCLCAVPPPEPPLVTVGCVAAPCLCRSATASDAMPPADGAHALQYHGGEPCAICGHRLEVAPTQAGAAPAAPPPKPPSAFPSEIVPGFLFLGSYDHASRHEILKTLGIGFILNVRAGAGGAGHSLRVVAGGAAGCHLIWAHPPQAVWHRLPGIAPTPLTCLLSPPCRLPQTVPSCQALYRNSFTYHTVSASPPPLDECVAFLGGLCLWLGLLLLVSDLWSGGVRCQLQCVPVFFSNVHTALSSLSLAGLVVPASGPAPPCTSAPNCLALPMPTAADEVQHKGGKVLVHCMSGLSRSPAVVICYLMRRNSWRLS